MTLRSFELGPRKQELSSHCTVSRLFLSATDLVLPGATKIGHDVEIWQRLNLLMEPLFLYNVNFISS